MSCLRYCKSTIFQANHNTNNWDNLNTTVVCDTAKVRFFKQITTVILVVLLASLLFAILQKYDFSSKSQLSFWWVLFYGVVCDTAKVRFFKQITTYWCNLFLYFMLFAILQKYDFSSKSQPRCWLPPWLAGCLRYCKSTIFQANHNPMLYDNIPSVVVCDTAKVRFFKQITTTPI